MDDNIKATLKYLVNNAMGWTHLAYERTHFLSFLITLATVNFLRRTLFYEITFGTKIHYFRVMYSYF